MAASWLEGSSEHRCHSPTRLYYLKTETLVHYLAPLQTFPSSFASLSASLRNILTLPAFNAPSPPPSPL